MTQGTFREALAVGCDLYDEDCYPNLKGAIRDAIKVHGFFSHAMPAGSRFDRVELMQNPTADQFFDAELALCKMMQDTTYRITEALDFE